MKCDTDLLVLSEVLCLAHTRTHTHTHTHTHTYTQIYIFPNQKIYYSYTMLYICIYVRSNKESSYHNVEIVTTILNIGLLEKNSISIENSVFRRGPSVG